MKKIHVSSINRKIEEDIPQFIRDSEAKYSKQISDAASQLYANAMQKPIILLSGPSGAGKTTSALRIEEILDRKGIATHTISMDNYFLPAHETPKACDENGDIDFESPHRLDIKLLNEHMPKIANCEPVEVPLFNFTEQRREKGTVLQRKQDELVVFEGIHALNPNVTGVSDEFANCIYVSVRTRLELEDGTLMHPSYIRLMRRLIRDKLYRGRKLTETMDMFESVERGKNLYITPYKDRAKINIDTFIPYEPSAYKNALYEDLKHIFETDEAHGKYAEMEDFFHALDSLPIEQIPDNSLVREFIGGSKFKY